MLQHGAYNLLMDAIYDREKFPTKDEAIDWTWASSADEIEAVEFVLRKFFVLEDGVYCQKRMQQELADFNEFCSQQREKGKKGGRPKKPVGLEKKPGGLNNEPDGNPMLSQKKPNPLTNNPLTNTNPPNGGCGNSKSSPVPYQRIVDLYHELLPRLPKVVKLSEKRKRAIRSRWKDDADNLDYWKSYFRHAATSKFLHGQNDRGWLADIDFLTREDVMIKMQEGKYHG